LHYPQPLSACYREAAMVLDPETTASEPIGSARRLAANRAHIKRVFAWWSPDHVEEHAFVQALADTPWRLEGIPGLESALYAQARFRGRISAATS
jgi:hypothetical protein